MADMDERKAFETWQQSSQYPKNPTRNGDGYMFSFTQAQWEAWQAATTAERERCANLSPNGLDVIASDSPAVVWRKYSEGIRKG